MKSSGMDPHVRKKKKPKTKTKTKNKEKLCVLLYHFLNETYINQNFKKKCHHISFQSQLRIKLYKFVV